MVKLGLRILLLGGFVIIGSLAVVGLSFNRNTAKYAYLGGIVDKHKRLHATPSPRIILIGGSGMAFGVDSPRVEQELGLPVVNMALHAALGLRYMLAEVESEIKPGDVIVISAEYDEFYGYMDGKETLLDMLLVYPQGAAYLTSPTQYETVVTGFPISMQEMVRGGIDGQLFGERQVNPVYRRDAFNAEGDVVSHLDLPFKDIGNLKIGLNSELDTKAITVLSEFARSAGRKGAKVLYAFPALPKPQYQTILNQTSELCRALLLEKSVILLDEPGDYVFPTRYFFDTVYHLNREGRSARTAKLIADLNRRASSGTEVDCESEE